MDYVDIECLFAVIKNVLSAAVFLECKLQNSSSSINLSSGDKIKQNAVDYVDKPTDYGSFFVNYMCKNKPCVFGSWITKSWQSREKWTSCCSQQTVADLTYFKNLCSSSSVPVADCRSQVFNSHEKTDWKFSDYVSYFHCPDNQEDCFYLKDWHFFRLYPEEKVYNVPEYFSSDWMYELYERQLPPFHDDFRFVYIGPHNSWSPFHADVFRSFSWSANICGRKKWIFFPPGTEKQFKDQNGHLPFDITLELEPSQQAPIEVVQEAGQIVFVPSGWFHQVHNLENTISINHNWLNGCNLDLVWKFLQSELDDVEREINDCRATMTPEEWTDQCQILMKANTGMNLHGFFEMLYHITNLRKKSLMSKEKFQIVDKVDEDFDSIKKSCYSIFTTLLSLCGETKGKPGLCQSVPHQIIDLCYLLPVLLDMCQYYKYKRVMETSKFLPILNSCHTCIHSYVQYIGCKPQT